MDTTARLARASRRLRLIFTTLLVLLPLADVLAWLYINDLGQDWQHNLLPAYARPPLPASARIMGLGASVLPMAAALYGIVALIRLFRLYEAGVVFREANVRCFRDLSRALLGWFAAGIVYQPFMSLALTLHHPPGQRQITLGLGTADLTALLVGLTLAVVAWVMDEGRKLQEEQDLTV